FNRQNGINRQQIARIIATGEFEHLAVRILDDHSGAQLAATRRGTPVNHDTTRDTRCLVRHFADRHAIHQILELHGTLHFREDGHGVGVPLGNPLAASDGTALVHLQARTIGELVRSTLIAVLVNDDHLHVAPHDDELTIGVLHHTATYDLHRARMARLEERAVDHLPRTTHAAGAHG